MDGHFRTLVNGVKLHVEFEYVVTYGRPEIKNKRIRVPGSQENLTGVLGFEILGRIAKECESAVREHFAKEDHDDKKPMDHKVQQRRS